MKQIKNILSSGGYWAAAFLTAALAYYIIKDANWIWGDDVIFITGSAAGKNNWIPMGAGRFFPLNFQEFNLLKYIPGGNLPFSHYLISASMFIAMMGLMLVFLNKIAEKYFPDLRWKSWFVLGAAIILAFAPDVLLMYLDIIFPERYVMLEYALFMLLYFRGMETGKLKYYAGAAIVGGISFFYKEPVFGTYLVITAVPFLFNYRQVTRGHKLFTVIVWCGIATYGALYYFLSYSKTTDFYNSGRVVMPFAEFLWSIFESHKLFFILILLAVYRFCKIVFVKQKQFLFTDSLLFAAISYIFAFILLKLNERYYFTPVYIMALPALFLTVIRLWQAKRLWGIVLLLLIGGIYSENYTVLKWNIINNQVLRHTDMVMVNQLAEKVKQGNELLWYQEINKKPENLFSNVSVTDRKSKLNNFLSYALKQQGINIKEIKEISPLGKNQILISVPENRLEKEIDYSVLGPDIKQTNALWLEIFEQIDFPVLDLPSEICFSDKCQNKNFNISGVSVPEVWGIWSDGKQSLITFRVKKSHRDISIKLNVNPFLTENKQENKGVIYVNNYRIAEWKFQNGKQVNPIEFIIPAKYIKADGVITLKFKIKNPQSPQELGISNDVRKLGLGFVSMKIK